MAQKSPSAVPSWRAQSVHETADGAGNVRRQEPVAGSLGLRPVPLDMDPVLVLARQLQIVVSLASQPELGVRPACLLQPERHLRRDCRVAVENPGQGVPGDI